jgi:UDP-N-acetylmuramate: L-alanyl-gamma-D-glutamyl-meso-diaminopimelate ligase
MRLGIHAETLPRSLEQADEVILYAADDLDWDAARVMEPLQGRCSVMNDTNAIVTALQADARPGDSILVMSNGGFEDIHQRILNALESRT